ncbi:hypothetical protein [Haladaptatus sp. T7]|uniref:COG1361 S-layer family protein n=1 Tax=Haladaptatus sp. T7 TaxID=2029368 RepID=UPI0021A25201|nr:hypothetical protein [Haladaptatus sp. T7]GKZ14148.1 hypothetical protein HAL_20290 [Haladaptatus sp. T7]
MNGRAVISIGLLLLVVHGGLWTGTANPTSGAAIEQEAQAPTGQFRIVSVASNVPINGTGNLSITFENTGEDVSNASISVRSPNESVRFGPSQTARKQVGNWAAGERRTVKYSLLAEEFAEVENYPFEANISFTAGDGSQRRAGPYTFGVQPSERIRLERFEVTSISSNVQAGDTGVISVTVENTGRDVNDAIVSLRSANEQLTLGRSPNASQFVNEWSSNERQTFQYRVTAKNDTVGGSYPFSLSISYREEGTRNRTEPHLIGIIPDPEQSFSFDTVTSTLRVGQEGTVSGTVTNEGPQRAPNAVLVLRSQGENLSPKETEYALGSLDAGESTPFEYRIDVSDSADRGPRQLSFVVRYQNQDGDPRQSKPLDARVPVGPRRDEFRIDAKRASVEAGSTATVSLVVTNNDDRTVRNIDAQAFVDSPLTINDNGAFIEKLEPNESATIRFDVSADGGTLPNAYPMSVDFQYDTPDGETKLTDTYEVPIRVTAPRQEGVLSFSSGTGGLVAIVVLAVLLVLVAVFVIRRR